MSLDAVGSSELIIKSLVVVRGSDNKIGMLLVSLDYII